MAAAAACAQVLAAVGCHGDAQGTAGNEEQFRKAAGSDLGRDVGAAQRIDAALQYHTADVVDGAHQAHAQARPEHIGSKFFAVGKGVVGKVQGRVVADDVPPAQHRTDALGYHGGGRRAATPSCSGPIKAMSSPMLSAVLNSKKYSGVRLFPMARSRAASIL